MDTSYSSAVPFLTTRVCSGVTHVGSLLTHFGSEVTRVGFLLTRVCSGVTRVGLLPTPVGSGATRVGSAVTLVGCLLAVVDLDGDQAVEFVITFPQFPSIPYLSFKYPT